MYIKLITKVFASHGGAFHMPTREAVTPWRGPSHDMTVFSTFPDGEIVTISFFGLTGKFTGIADQILNPAT